VSSKFTFPETLNMSSRLSVEESNGLQSVAPMIYEVSALLIHRGSTADSGHYVANIKDDTTGEWWEFDDELVTSLGSSPFREPAAPASRKEIPGKESRAQDEAPTTENRLTSADAYMLIYNLQNSSKTECGYSDDSFHLPHELQCRIENQNKEIEESCAAYKLAIDSALSSRAERKAEIKTILSAISAGNDKCFFWISSNWLRIWADELEPP
jgi:ubiquitin carboxyl-terminal hydrolase 48